DGEMLEEVARHLVQLWLAGSRDDHAKVERIPLELGLHRERFHLLDRIPGQKRLLRRLKDIGVLGAEVTAGGIAGRSHHHPGQYGGRDTESGSYASRCHDRSPFEEMQEGPPDATTSL